jgi:hypothetical protein
MGSKLNAAVRFHPEASAAKTNKLGTAIFTLDSGDATDPSQQNK